MPTLSTGFRRDDRTDISVGGDSSDESISAAKNVASCVRSIARARWCRASATYFDALCFLMILDESTNHRIPIVRPGTTVNWISAAFSHPT
jgi:hypothetical protein